MAAFVYFVGSSSNSAVVEFDKPTFVDFADSVAYGNLSIVGRVIKPGTTVLDAGIDDTPAGDSQPRGLPVAVAQIRVTTVLALDKDAEARVQEGDTINIVFAQTPYVGGASEEQRALTEGDALLLSLEFLPAGSSAVIDSDTYTPVGMDNGVMTVGEGGLVPWESIVSSVGGMPTGDVAVADLPALLGGTH